MVWPKQTTANADVPTRVIRVERIFFPNPIARDNIAPISRDSKT
jgi:hypothetical protein